MRLSAIFLFLISIALTLSPAVRNHSWQVDLKYLHWIGFLVWLGVFSVIHFQIRKRIPGIDPFIIPIVALLSGWGLLIIWRLDSYLGLRQSIWLGIAAGIFVAGIRFPSFIRWLRKYKYIWLILGLLLTALTLVIGTYPGGSGPTLWLNIAGVFFQPSEPLKLLLIVYLSAYFADHASGVFKGVKLLIPTLILIASASILLVAQRDLGTAVVFVLIFFIVVFLASGNYLVLLAGGVFTLVAGLLGYQTFPIIEQRLNTWINPWADPMGSSYQIIQSLIAVASGGVIGRGAGLGNPNIVPIAHSDFIFTALSEEFGLIGTIGLILLFILLSYRSMRVAIQAPNQYRRLLAAGLTGYFNIQAILIVAGNLNLLPLSGITLPFVSYGGSSLVVSFSAIAILAIISSQAEDEVPIPIKIKPYRMITAGFFLAWILLAMTNGYWTFLRAKDLVNRTDNPRMAISDYYVPRGSLVDRNNQPITDTSGERGEYQVHLLYPSTSNIVGYSSLYFGQAGLQASLDSYLRGLQGTPSSEIWLNYLLYSQRPPGLNVRLSLDIDLQNAADQLLEGNIGAATLLNSQTGEILAMSTYPFYDANLLQDNYEIWQADPNAPFLNRVTQGQYYPGTALAPFLLYQALQTKSLPPFPENVSYQLDEQVLSCAKAPDRIDDWAQLVTNGCPGAAIALADAIPEDELKLLWDKLGFRQAPTLSLPVAETTTIETEPLPMETALGIHDVYVSPLQIALAASALNNNGARPDASLVLAVQTPLQGWVILNQDAPQQAINSEPGGQVVQMLSIQSPSIWQVLGQGNALDGGVTTWYIGGTTSAWKGSPLVVVVMLEADAPGLTAQIGQNLLNTTLQPESN